MEIVEEGNDISNAIPSGRHKKPLFTFEDGNTYLGEWVGNQPDGFGIFTTAKGTRYEGYLANGLKHGYGRHFGADGNTYEGDWEDGRMTGRGVYRWAKGDVYEGGLLEGKRHGVGWM